MHSLNNLIFKNKSRYWNHDEQGRKIFENEKWEQNVPPVPYSDIFLEEEKVFQADYLNARKTIEI